MSKTSKVEKGSETPEVSQWLVIDKNSDFRHKGGKHIGIGARVRCNSLFASAFEGQEGTITGSRIDVFGKRLWTITFDNPTPAAKNWTPLETLAAEENCYDLL